MQDSGNSKQPVLIIAGMHRSGTSLTASLLQSAGVDVGQRLLGVNPGNAKGHFENLDFLNFHQAVLRSTGISEAGWTLKHSIDVPEYYIDAAKLLIQKNASSTQPWAWKDPRTVLFLNFWNNLIPNAKFIFVYRSPWEVADSLYRRGDEIFHHNPNFALDLWMSYNQAILAFYQQFPDKCVLAHLDAIASDTTAFVESIGQQLGVSITSPEKDIYDPSLLNSESSSQRATLIQRYFPDVYALYQQLNCTVNFCDHAILVNQELASPTAWLLKDWLDVRVLEAKLNHEVSCFRDHLSSSQVQLARLEQEKQQIEQEKQQVDQEKQQLQAEFCSLLESKNQLQEQFQAQLKHCQAEVAAMKTSKFWQLRSQWFKLKSLLRIKK
ncbi:MAG: sulfotransferase [Lyngbya sp. HA4199-MV5]|jgi:hypothetical protein|nr:sulfotransferase [Lyngbya sp. HA4199-MV5]